jgi:hypothetical protein
MIVARTTGVLFVPLFVYTGPFLTRLHESGSRIARPAAAAAGGFVALAAVPLIIMNVWPEVVMRLMYGPGFSDAAALLAPLGAVMVITYTSIMLGQFFVTLRDFRFLRLFAIASMVQICGLLSFHRTVREVIAVLFVAQGALLGGMIVMMFRERHR